MRAMNGGGEEPARGDPSVTPCPAAEPRGIPAVPSRMGHTSQAGIQQDKSKAKWTRR